MIPAFLYGTAWKKEKTADLVYQALCTGFEGVDTAAQPKHYREDLVGEGLRRAIGEGWVSRERLFVSKLILTIRFSTISTQKRTNPFFNRIARLADIALRLLPFKRDVFSFYQR